MLQALASLALVLICVTSSDAVEVAVLHDSNWDGWAPQGKEADAIYGDYVLRNANLVAVVGDAQPTRHANMTVRRVGGSLIDLTLRGRPNDQLSAYYPAPERELTWQALHVDGKQVALDGGEPLTGRSIELSFRAVPRANAPELEVVYRLDDADEGLRIISRLSGISAQSDLAVAADALRADGEFELGGDQAERLVWFRDPFWRQAYVVAADKGNVTFDEASLQKKRPLVRYEGGAAQQDDGAQLVRRIFPAEHDAAARAKLLRFRGTTLYEVALQAADQDGAVGDADYSLTRDGAAWSKGLTAPDGSCRFDLPEGLYRLELRHPAHGAAQVEFRVPESNAAADSPASIDGRQRIDVRLERAGYAAGSIVDEAGQPIACKIDFAARDSGVTPDFGPDSAIQGIRNLYYAPHGKVRVALAPGIYDVVASHGPEYDAAYLKLDVKAGETVSLTATLPRSIATPGWISADFHSHASPSGDNAASQRGRVLNLLAEHIEFAPCTEHARVATYDEQLAFFGLRDAMASCPGMELTGNSLRINHQNAFPLIHRERRQNGGGPETDPDPEVQIERLAMWDDASAKLVQINHPHIPQMLGDRDLNGKGDAGFRRMLGIADVIEVHPPADLFERPGALPLGENDSKPMFHWLQLLNLGYRIPGVVNTDAHWNFHGSGWLRNYVRSSTDEPSRIDAMEMVRRAEQAQIVMTNGPYLECVVRADGEGAAAEIGHDLAAPNGDVTLHVRVQCANWLDVNRVQVFVNGRPHPQANFTRRSHPDLFRNERVKFQHNITLHLDEDAHLIVGTIGEGLALGRVAGPVHGSDPPTAVGNPIFVDVDGNGFQPNGDELDLPLPRLP